MTKATRFGKEVKWDGKVICQASSDKTAESLLRVLNKDPELTRRCFTTEMLLDTVYGRAGGWLRCPGRISPEVLGQSTALNGAMCKENVSLPQMNDVLVAERRSLMRPASSLIPKATRRSIEDRNMPS